MCDECGCQDKEKKENTDNTIVLDKSVTEQNDKIAHDTWHNLKDKCVLCVNIMGAPGSGKTTLIENLSSFIHPSEIFVIQGDLESDIDKVRLEKSGIQTYQINTHSGCHLNANMIKSALESSDLAGKKYLFIENVGNLVCPAGVKLGQHINLVVSSTTEGSDKPKKYPLVFMDAGLVVISKYDLASAVDFNEEMYLHDLNEINSSVEIIKVSSKDKESFSEIADFLKSKS